MTDTERRAKENRLLRLLAYLVVVVFFVGITTAYLNQLDRANKYKNAYKTTAIKYGQTLHANNIPLPEVSTTPVITLPGVPGKNGTNGSNGSNGVQGPGPSRAQVQRAVDAFCANQACQGEAGVPGHSVTSAQVAEAVATYCNANGKCEGPTGQSGQAGQAGSEGATGPTGATGAQGPGPTGDQIAAAVANFCANGNCDGPKGDKGDTGSLGSGPYDVTCPTGSTDIITGAITGSGCTIVPSTPTPTSTP